MKVNLLDVIYTFGYYTHFEILDRQDSERIFSGTRAEVINWLNQTGNNFTISFGVSKGYFDCKDSTVIIYPDYEISA